jgi:hypothetical protein
MERQNNDGDGLIRNDSGQIVAIRHQGTVYRLEGVQEEDFDEIELYLKQRRKSPLDAIKEELANLSDNPQLREALIDRAYRDLRKEAEVSKISMSEVRDYLDTREGAIHSIWIVLRRQKPDLTREEVTQLFRDVSTAEALKRRDEVSQELLKHTGS